MIKCIENADCIFATRDSPLLQRTFLTMSRNNNDFSYFSYKEKKHLHRSIYHAHDSKYAKFHKVLSQIHENTGSQTCLFIPRSVCQRVTLETWHTFLCKHLHIFLILQQILIQVRLFTKLHDKSSGEAYFLV